ncbi:MAG: HAD family phosphatase [Nitrosopumilus sp.]|nr:HAD family phosphatase [Nitrosopumilus sp.]
MSDIRCVLFDIGGVLVDWHMSWITSEISKQFEINEDIVTNAFSKHLHDLDSGKINEKIFWQKIAHDTNSIPLKENTESLWDIYFRKRAKLNHDVINLAKTIKEKSYTIGIISNIEKITHKVVDDWKVLTIFENKFLSYQIGFSKPDPRIYEYVIEKLPFDSNQMLFVDDKESNIDAAKSSGMNAIHFTNCSELEKSLFSYGIRI